MAKHYSFVVVGVDDCEIVVCVVAPFAFAFVAVAAVSKVSAAACVLVAELDLNRNPHPRFLGQIHFEVETVFDALAAFVVVHTGYCCCNCCSCCYSCCFCMAFWIGDTWTAVFDALDPFGKGQARFYPWAYPQPPPPVVVVVASVAFAAEAEVELVDTSVFSGSFWQALGASGMSLENWDWCLVLVVAWNE